MTKRTPRIGLSVGAGLLFLGAGLARAGDEVSEGRSGLLGLLSPAMLGQEGSADAPDEGPSFWDTLNFGGYVETSYTWNVDRPRDENVARIFDFNSNEFMLNAVQFHLERPVDDDHLVGFVVRPLIGQTAPVVQSAGFDGDEKFDLVQAYIQGVIPWAPGYGTKVYAGKFATTTGAEVIWAPDNDHFSRSLLFGLAIPFTHTGILASQPLLKTQDESDLLALIAGISNGWDNVKDQNESKLILSALNFTPCAEFGLLSNFYYSFSEQDQNDENGRTLVDLVATVKPFASTSDNEQVKNIKLLGNFDWGGEEGAATTGGYAEWYGFAGSLVVPVALPGGEWYVATRGEFFDDVGGSRIAGSSGFTNVQIWEMTFTLDYRPIESLILRGEVRYDKADEKIFNDGSTTADQSYQTTLALQAIVKI